MTMHENDINIDKQICGTTTLFSRLLISIYLVLSQSKGNIQFYLNCQILFRFSNNRVLYQIYKIKYSPDLLHPGCKLHQDLG